MSLPAVAPAVTAMADTIIDATAVDYLIVFIYFAVVLGIGVLARRQVSDSVDFFLSGRSLPAWVTGLAFISATLGAVEIMGMSANGAQFGIPTVHYFWIGAIPAMLFLGVVMMPFYYGSKVRSVPEFMFRRFGTGAHLVNAISFAVAQLLIAGINLFLLASIVHALLGWPQWLALIVALVSTVLTALAGFVDWLTIEWGSPLWKTATWHALAMVTAGVLFLVAALVGHDGYVQRGVTTGAFILTLLGFATLTLGGWLGGAITYVYGMRVLSLPEEPAAKAAAPYPSEEKVEAEA